MIDLTEKLLKRYPPKPGKVGRYSCSKIWAFINGYCTPQQYLDGEEVDFKGAMNMFNGTHKHAMIQSLLEDDYFMEYKKEKYMSVGDCPKCGEKELEIATINSPLDETSTYYCPRCDKFVEIPNFTIVGVADCINQNEILEIKTSQKVHDKAKPWAAHQLKLYLTLFEIPKGRIVQPIISKGLYLKVLGEYKRNDQWFEKEMLKLAEFHKQLCQKNQ